LAWGKKRRKEEGGEAQTGILEGLLVVGEGVERRDH